MAIEAEVPRRPYNSRIIHVYVKLIQRRYPEVNLSELFNYAGMKAYEVYDDGHWFSQEQVDRFYEKTVQLTGNLMIAREAGRFASSQETAPLFRRYFLGFLGPLRAYAMLEKSASLITRSSVFRVIRVNSHCVDIISTPLPGISERPYQCDNRMGILESIAFTFTQRLPKVEHGVCIHAGEPHCRYRIQWEQTVIIPLRRLRYAFASVGVIAAGVTAPLFSLNTWIISSLTILSANLILTLSAKYKEYNRLREALEELRQSTEDLALQTRINYNHTTVSHEVGEAISKYSRIDDVLSQVARTFNNLLNYDRGLIMLANRDETLLEFRAGFGYSEEHLQLLKQTPFHLNKKESRGAFVLSFREKKSFLINDLDEIEGDLSRRSLAFARSVGTRSFICCPIVCEEEALGVLAVDNVQSKQPLLNSDLNMLKGIASVIGMSIKNARLIQNREAQFKSIIRVLASSIDARDNLTAGHSEKVTEYAVGISRQMGLSKEFQDMIRIAALLHDYGKIGVPDSILKKQGPLTAQEYEIIKTHASKTRVILSQINFDGMYTQVPEIASSHHERLDGKGYPRGLGGTEIPLGARIIGVADFYDAITSQRHYRKPMKAEEALELLMNEADDHLDRRVIAAFFHYLTQKQGISSELIFSEQTV